MKQKEKTSLKSLDTAELRQKISEARGMLEKSHLEKATTQVKNSRQDKKLRQTIAVASSYIREKELSHE